MLKILQVGDVHLDAILEYLPREKRESRNKIIEETFVKIIDLALTEKVKFFLLTGDLFESNRPSKRVIDLVRQQLKRLQEAEINIIILPGSHDYWAEESVYQKIKQEEGIYLFTAPTWEEFFFSNYGISFYGYASDGKDNCTQRVLHKLIKKNRNGLYIGLLHGSLADLGEKAGDYYPFSLGELEGSGLDYWALGHHHRCWVKETGVKAGYAGSPEGLDFQELGNGYVLLLTIEENQTNIQKKKVNTQELKQLDIDCQDYRTFTEIESRIKQESNTDVLLRVILKGETSPKLDLDDLKSSLQQEFFYLDICDRTIKSYSELEESQGWSIKSYFLKLMKKRISNAKSEKEKKKLERALTLGIQSLTGGEEGC